jgi:mediator of replication checkpoint protein 1
MRKALLADEKVGKIAEDPKKLAFLRAIEDREDREYEDLAEPESQDAQNAAATAEQEIPDSQPASTTAGTAQAGSKRKRPLEPTTANSRRRMQNLPSKPLSLSEIRASVSFLTEDPRKFSMEPSALSDLGSDADDEGGDSRGAKGSAFSRRNPATAVIDRLSLKRGESLQTSTASATARMAFQAPDTSAAPGFRVPSLLRRATTGLSSFSENSYSSGSGSGSGGRAGSASIGTSRSNSSNNTSSLTAEAVKRGASKKSSVNYVAREAARRTQIDGVEKRRTEGILKARKRGVGIGGVLGCGRWE